MHMRSIQLAIVSGLVGFASASTAAPQLHTEVVRITGPTIVAFVPSEFKDSQEESSIEGSAHLRFAVEDTLKFLKPRQPQVHLLYAEVVSVQNGAASERIAAHRLGQSVGALLVEPGRKSKVVYSVDGPSTLLYLLPQAAYGYWGAKGCEQ